MKKLLTSVLLASTFAFTACTTTSTTAPTTSTPSTATAESQLNGKTWVVTHINGVAVPAKADATQLPSLQLDSTTQRVSGSDGCNRIMGGFTSEGTQLKFGHLASTMMACIDEDNTNVSAQYTAALAQVTQYQVTDQILILKDAAGKAVLQFNTTK